MATPKRLMHSLAFFVCFFVALQGAQARSLGSFEAGYFGAASLGAESGDCQRSDTIPGSCPMNDEIEKIITEAISLGAPIYNEGLHIACYRIYEWAAYKILYEYGKKCGDIGKTLKMAIDKSHGDYSDTEKAWIMRMAFDKVLGVPTQTKDADPPKSPELRKG